MFSKRTHAKLGNQYSILLEDASPGERNAEVQCLILLLHAAVQVVLGQMAALAIVVLVVFEAGQVLLHELAALAYQTLPNGRSVTCQHQAVLRIRYSIYSRDLPS